MKTPTIFLAFVTALVGVTIACAAPVSGPMSSALGLRHLRIQPKILMAVTRSEHRSDNPWCEYGTLFACIADCELPWPIPIPKGICVSCEHYPDYYDCQRFLGR
jgi:hypothetical protein